MKKATLLGSLLVTLHSFGQSDTVPTFVRDSLDNYMNRALKTWNIPGAAVCIVKDGKVVVMKGYGVKEAGTTDKVDEHTLFMIGSNTKAFTATALAMLEYDTLAGGKPRNYSLNDRVQKWLPGFTLSVKPAGEHTIIRDLLCHRIGLESSQVGFSNWTSNLTRKEVIAQMKSVKFLYPFRTGWSYSNASFVAAGEILPAVTGLSWEDFLKERIFTPLQMNHTLALGKDLPTVNNRSVPHTVVDSQLIKLPYPAFDNLGAAGSISSSVSDLSHWVIALLAQGKYNGKQVIPAGAIEKTWFPHAIISDKVNLFNSGHFFQYGLGWFMQEYNGSKVVAHSGGVNGFVSSVTLVPEKGLGIILLTNSDKNVLFQALFWEVMDAWLGLPYRNYIQVYADRADARWKKEAMEDKTLRDSAALKIPAVVPLTAYTGSYVNELYGEMTVVFENNELLMKLSHHPHTFAKLVPIGNNRFYTRYTDVNFGTSATTFKMKDHKIVAASIKVSDNEVYGQMEFIKK